MIALAGPGFGQTPGRVIDCNFVRSDGMTSALFERLAVNVGNRAACAEKPKRVVKLPLLAVFVCIVSGGIVLIGYFFNSAGPLLI